MASFEWKRKIGEKVSKAASQQFEAEAGDDKDLVDDDDVNWVHATKRRKEILLEDCVKKSKQLKVQVWLKIGGTNTILLFFFY